MKRSSTTRFRIGIRRPLILHPIFFAIFPPLFLYSINLWQTEIDVLWNPLTHILYATLLLWYLLQRIFGRRLLVGLLTSLTLFMFFAYGHIHGALLNREIFIGYHRFLLPLWLLLFGLGVVLVFRLRSRWQAMTFILNLVSALFVLQSLVGIAKWVYSKSQATSLQLDGIPEVVLEPTNNLPDIYYIILDGYMRSDYIKTVLDYDNAPFLTFLRERGFYIAEKSHSNYPYTIFSLASSLNMSYVNFLSRSVGEDSKDFNFTYPIIQSNEVARLLKTIGYRYVLIGTDWTVTNHSPLADKSLSYFSLSDENQFYSLFLKTSIVSVLMESTEDMLRATKLYAFDQIPLAGDDGKPTFVFAHILAPHSPYVFDAQGGRVESPEEGRDTEGTKHAYLEQLKFVNLKTEELVSKLLDQPDPPIIVLQSDHGWAWAVGWDLYPASPIDQHFDYDQIFGNLNAYYLPGKGSEGLYPTITPVNSFRHIFNLYFNASMRFLPDESYYSDYYKSPYRFQNVTPSLSM